MLKVDPVASRKRMVHAPTLVLAMAFSLSACVDLTPPWDKKVQTSDAQAVGGRPDTGASASGGAGGSDAGNGSSSVASDPMDASAAGGESDSSSGGGVAGGSSGSGGAVAAPDAGGAGGAPDALRVDGAVDAPVVSGGDAARDGGSGRDVPDGGGQGDRPDSLSGLGNDGGDSGADSSSDRRPDVFEANSGIETASDGPLPMEVGADTFVPPDLALDTSPDLAPDLPPDQATCQPRTFDAKTANHSAGLLESDGWYLSASGQFLWWTDIVYPAGRTTVTVVARGDYDSGAWPTMDVSAQGQGHIIGSNAAVSSSTMTAYNFTFDAEAMTSGVGITAKTGKGVHVQSVTISCPSH